RLRIFVAEGDPDETGCSVREGNLDRHPVLRNCSLLKYLTSLLDELLGTDRIPRRHMTQHEAAGLGRQRNLRRLARRRMPRLLRHTEPPPPLVLAESVTHGATAVLGSENVNVVRGARCAVAADDVAWLDLTDLDLERDSLHPELQRVLE